MTFKDAVLEYFPDASEEEVEFILWEKTGFPCFWDIPKDGNTEEECLRKQLLEFKESLE